MAKIYTYIKYKTMSGKEKQARFKGFADDIFIGDEIEIDGEICKIIDKETRKEE